MSIFQNPVARREWIWAKRHWLAGLAILITAVGASALITLVLTPWLFSARLLPFWLSTPLLSWWLRIPTIVALFLVITVLERERQCNGWEQLASTRLTSREILWGKLAVPVGFLWAVSTLMFLLSLIWLVHLLRFLVVEGEGSVLAALVTYPAGLIEDLLYDVLACVLVFRCGRRRSLGHGLLVSAAVLLGVGLGLAILAQVSALFSSIFLTTMGPRAIMDMGWHFAAQNVAINLPASVVELWLIVRISRRLEAEMRSDLAAGTMSRLG